MGADSTPDSRFLCVVTGRNVEAWVEPLVASLAAQTRDDWQAVFVDDASEDASVPSLEKAVAARDLAARFRIVRNRERRHKARNVFDVLSDAACPRAEIVVLLDGDDLLATPDALAVLDREYRRGFDVVWSNWLGSDGSKGKSDYLSPLLHPSRQPFVSQHLFSFRRRLFDRVRPQQLQDAEGAWFAAGCDAALAWPLLEQTRRWRFVNRVLCIYNRENPASHKARGNKREQLRTLAALQDRASRVRRPPDLGFAVRHAGSLAFAALMNARLVRRYSRHRRRLRAVRAGRTTLD